MALHDVSLIRQLAARMPASWQLELKRLYFRRQIGSGRFATAEPEFAILDQLLTAGDWVLDIGANVGHYTRRFSDLVGPQGRVIAFEPVPTTFSLLAANMQLLTQSNVTLINAAVSSHTRVVGMSIPRFDSGLTNYYEATITDHAAEAAHSVSVMTLSIDNLQLAHRIALIKIDAEDHESAVLEGMRGLILQWHPTLIVETQSAAVIDWVTALGYAGERLPDSPNVLFRPRNAPVALEAVRARH